MAVKPLITVGRIRDIRDAEKHLRDSAVKVNQLAGTTSDHTTQIATLKQLVETLQAQVKALQTP